MVDHNGMDVDGYAAIGRVAVESVVLETMTEVLASWCCDDLMAFNVLLANQSWRWKKEKTELLIRFKVQDPQAREAALDWLRRVDDLQNQRNKAVHAYWQGGEDGRVLGSRTRAARRNATAPHEVLRTEVVASHEVVQLAEDMVQLRVEWPSVYDGVVDQRAVHKFQDDTGLSDEVTVTVAVKRDES